MGNFLSTLSFKIAKVSTEADSSFFSPPSWPPPDDWVVSFDSRGNPLSRWGDISWDFSAWAGRSFKIRFVRTADRRSVGELDARNVMLLRLATTYLIWGPRGVRGWNTLLLNFNRVRRIVTFCDINNIYAGDLSRFPKLQEQFTSLFASSQDRSAVILTLDRLQRASADLGFTILDEYSIAQVSRMFDDSGPDETVQTAYIPPRIWLYQLARLRACLEDFLEHADAFEKFYNFCLDAYAKNYGSLEAAFGSNRISSADLPFGKKRTRTSRKGLVYAGTFEDVAKQFGVHELLVRWVAPQRDPLSVKSLSTYAGLIQIVAVCYIANFTLQRKEEAAALRLDCLLWDEDPILGRIAIIRGETTKTDPDSDARWPTSPSVELAVNAGQRIARMRVRCVKANPKLDYSDIDLANPTFLQFNVEPWGGRWDGRSSIRITTPSYSSLYQRFPRLFDLNELKISESDLNTAKMFTPNLSDIEGFELGAVWPLAFHQLRRTGGINMFASGMLSASSIQVIMKHLTLLQTMYYGKHFSNSRFNEEVEGITSASRFEVLAKQIQTLMSERYVSPQGESRKSQIIVNLVGGRDFKKLVSAGERGELSFRETRLGGCAKTGPCEYGGMESVASCAGSEGRKPCTDAIFDKQRRPGVMGQLADVERRIAESPMDSPRRRALISELQGMRNYLDVTKD